MTNKITYPNFNRNVPFLQLSMNFNVDTIIPEDNKVRLVCNIVERMDLDSLLSTYSHRGRKPALDPVTFLKIILFCFSEGIFETRRIEDFCKYDLRGRYLLGGRKAPDHSTVSRFQNLIIDYMNDLLKQFVEILLEDGHVDLKSLYIDGTKIEAIANRYTFVWRKSVEKHQNKLKEKMIEELNIPIESSLDEVISMVRIEFDNIRNKCSKMNIQFVYGSGRRKTEEQKKYEHYQEVNERFQVYKKHLEIMGDRNSYSKTDHDATFMRMKDDHMRNGQLKPAYNIQMASSGAFIVGVMGSQHPNDLNTLKPFLKQMLPSYGSYIENIVADAGYESAENYMYLKDANLNSYIKPSNYEVKNKKKVKEEDVYICKAGKKLTRQKDRIKKTKSGFKDTIKVYTCYECKDCQYSSQCIKSRVNLNPDMKSIVFSPAFEEYRKESETNIATAEGINQRINRSIQAEGAFSKIKDGLGYDRYRHKSMRKIIADTIMVAMGVNLNKLHIKILKGQIDIIEYKKVA